MKYIKLYEDFSLNEAKLPDTISAMEKKIPSTFKFIEFFQLWYDNMKRFGSIEAKTIRFLQSFDEKFDIDSILISRAMYVKAHPDYDYLSRSERQERAEEYDSVDQSRLFKISLDYYGFEKFARKINSVLTKKFGKVELAKMTFKAAYQIAGSAYDRWLKIEKYFDAKSRQVWYNMSHINNSMNRGSIMSTGAFRDKLKNEENPFRDYLGSLFPGKRFY